MKGNRFHLEPSRVVAGMAPEEARGSCYSMPPDSGGAGGTFPHAARPEIPTVYVRELGCANFVTVPALLPHA